MKDSAANADEVRIKIKAYEHAASAVRQIPRPAGRFGEELTKIERWHERKAAELRAQLEAQNDPKEENRGAKFADWFRGTLAAEAVPVHGWREKWAKCFDEMIRLDGRTPEQIFQVCQWARQERFWRGNFLSPLKLRQRDRSNALYFDRFVSEMGSARKGSGGAAAVAEGKHYQEGTAPVRRL